MAVAPDGMTTVAWARKNGSNFIIQAATRSAGSNTFGAAQDVSQPGVDATNPEIAVAPDGTATIAWESHEGATQIVKSATRPAGSDAFGTPQDLSPAGGTSRVPDVAVAPDGTTTVVWELDNGAAPGPSNTVQVATRRAGSGTFSAPANLSTTRSAQGPRLAVAGDGATTVTWRGDVIQATTRPAGAETFSAPQDLSEAGGQVLDPQVAVGRDGSAAVTWWRNYTGVSYDVEAATRPASATAFGTTEVLSVRSPDKDGAYPDVAIGPDGTTTIVWQFSDGIDSVIQEATRAAGSGAFSAPHDISQPGQSEFAKVAFAADGATTVVWQHAVTPNYIVQATTRPSGSSTFSAPQDLSAGGGSSSFPQLATASDGTVTTTWARNLQLIQAVSSAPTKYTLTARREGTGAGVISSDPAGISCGAACSASLNLSTSVTLTATASQGSTFAGWGDACSGTSSTCTLLMLGDRAATATFAKLPPSNVFRISSTAPRGSSVRTRVRVPGPGRLAQRGRYRADGTSHTACTTSRNAKRAGYYTLTCRLDAAARKQRRRGSLRVTVRTTFTPSGGTPRSTVRRVTFRALRPRFAG